MPSAVVEKAQNLEKLSPRVHRPPSGLRQGQVHSNITSLLLNGAEDDEDTCHLISHNIENN